MREGGREGGRESMPVLGARYFSVLCHVPLQRECLG